MDLKTFVKNKRLDVGMNQETYAQKIGISPPTLNRIEQGKKIGIFTLRALSCFYGLEVKILRKLMLNNGLENYE